jgi:hypothetical protein
MLFDLRGRGRRRTMRVIYIGLAALIGLGLVGFGIGGGFGGGGLLTAATNNEGAGSASFSSQIKRYQKLTANQPTNVSAWENLTRALLHEAGGEAYVTRSGEVTGKGKELFKADGDRVRRTGPQRTSAGGARAPDCRGREAHQRGAVCGTRAVRLQGAQRPRR